MPGEITTHDAQYALDIVKKICAEVGPGLPGTPQERARGEILKNELSSHLGADNVVTEEFTLLPGAFLSTLPAVICMLVAIRLNLLVGHIPVSFAWIAALVAFLLALFPPASFFLEFILSLEVFDPLFPKKQSTNVIGTFRKPGATQVKRLLIISGHHDSAFENTWIRYAGKVFYFLSATFVIGAVALPVICLIQLVGLALENDAWIRAGTLKWYLLVYPIVPAMIYAAFLTRGRKNGGIVPGAADNLSACAVVVSMCRFLVDNPSNIPDDTEIRFISFGSEEAGLRGSRRYVERHLDELKKLDAQVLNYEVVAHPVINIPATDVNGTLKYQPAVIESAVAAAQRAQVPYRMGSGGIGAGSDAAPFRRVGLRANTLLPFKTPEQFLAFYHQDRDTPELVTIEPLFNTLKFTLEWIRHGGA